MLIVGAPAATLRAGAFINGPRARHAEDDSDPEGEARRQRRQGSRLRYASVCARSSPHMYWHLAPPRRTARHTGDIAGSRYAAAGPFLQPLGVAMHGVDARLEQAFHVPQFLSHVFALTSITRRHTVYIFVFADTRRAGHVGHPASGS